MKKEISISMGALIKNYGFTGALDKAVSLGVDGIDYDLNDYNLFTNQDCIYHKSEEEFTAFFENVRQEVEKRGLKVFQTHGAMRTFRENDEEYNTVTFPKNAELDLKASKILGARACIFHPGATLSNMHATPEEMRKNARRAFKMILPFAKKYDVKIALETVGSNYDLDNQIDFFGAYEEFRALFDDVKKMNPEYAEYFVCCIDTGHVNLAVQHNQPTPGEFIRLMGDNVEFLHLHDNTGYIDQHRPLCSGTIDWNDVFKALKEIGFSGNYNSEVSFGNVHPDLVYVTADYTVQQIKVFASRY